MTLIAHYPLNGDTKDYSGYVRNVTLSGTIKFVDEGKIGRCLDGGAITLPAGVMNKFRQSISFWYFNKMTTSASTTHSQFMGNSSPRDYALFAYPNNNDLHWNFRNENNSNIFAGSISNLLPNKKWTHITVVNDEFHFKIYVNGVLEVQQVVSTWDNNVESRTFPLIYDTPQAMFNDVRIYNHALSDKEVKELAKAKVLHYKFDEQDLTTKIVKDCSGFGNDGTVADTTAPTWSEDSPVGRGSMDFSGSKFIDANHKIPLMDDFTVSFWVNRASTATATLGCSRTVLGKGFSIFFSINGTIRWDTGDQQWSTGHAVKLNQWVHYTLVRRGNAKELYENGVLVKSISYTGSMTNLGSSYSIGRSHVGGGSYDNYLNGTVSDYRIYATALSPEDILELYQTRASVDNEGNLFVHEIDEMSPTLKSIDSRGIAQYKEFNEVGSENRMSIKNDGEVYVNEIMEV